MNDHLQCLRRLVEVNDNLVDQGAGDLLFQHHRARGIVPHRRKVVTERQDGIGFSRTERRGGVAVCVEFALEPFQCFELVIPALLEHLGDQAIGGVDLVILIKRALGLVFHLLYLAL